MNSKEIENFMHDIRSDLENLDELINYYDFLGHHNIRSIVFSPENDSDFFDGSVVAILDQRYREFFRSRFNSEIDELTRVDVLEIIRAHLPNIQKKLDF